MNIIYQHAQKGWVSMGIIGGMLLIAVVMITWVNPPHPDSGQTIYFICGFITLLLALLYRLKVTITDTEIRVQYGIAPAFPVFRLEDIADAQAVRNPWWVGWGIRFAFDYWVYNVSGFDAVELLKKDGSRVRIGTDEPEILAQKIREQLKK
jgi:hypothetical protein